MTTWFTADTHFGHANIIKYCNRPFVDVNEMNETLIRNWNAVVKPTDVVWHLGDFAFGTDMTAQKTWEIHERLHGVKNFIEGNHDELLKKVLSKYEVLMLNKYAIRRYIGSLAQYSEIAVEGQKIVLFHYGLRTWHHDLRGTWHLYGHSHGGLPPLGKSCDVGMDATNFAPVSFEQLKLQMSAREIHKASEFENFVLGK